MMLIHITFAAFFAIYFRDFALFAICFQGFDRYFWTRQNTIADIKVNLFNGIFGIFLVFVIAVSQRTCILGLHYLGMQLLQILYRFLDYSQFL